MTKQKLHLTKICNVRVDGSCVLLALGPVRTSCWCRASYNCVSGTMSAGRPNKRRFVVLAQVAISKRVKCKLMLDYC